MKSLRWARRFLATFLVTYLSALALLYLSFGDRDVLFLIAIFSPLGLALSSLACLTLQIINWGRRRSTCGID